VIIDPKPQRVPKAEPGDNGAPARPVEVIYRDRAPRPPGPQPAVPDRTASHDIRDGGLVEYWTILRRRKSVVLTAVFVGALSGFVLTIPQTPIYQAHTTVEVQGLNENFLNIRDVSPTSTVPSDDPTLDILTQVKILESQRLRDRVIQKLKAKPDPGFTVRTDRLDMWKKALGLAASEPLRREAAIAMTAGTVSAKATGTTRIIDLTCDSPDPKLAAEFANALVQEFMLDDVESRLNATELTGEWLAKQLEDLKSRLEKSEDQLQAYASTVGLQLTGDNGKDVRENVADDKLRQLQTELLHAESERVAAQSKYELVTTSPADTLPQVLDDLALREYQTKLTDLRRQMADLGSALTPENPKVVRLQAQIGEVESALTKERDNIVSRIRNDYEFAQRRQDLLSAQYAEQTGVVNDQASKAIHYNILKREVDTNRQIYEAMLQKVKEAGVATAMRASSFRVVDPAKVPGAPYKPVPSRMALAGGFGGLVFGVALVLFRERADRSLQQPGDLSLYLNLPELGVIPSDRASAPASYGARTQPSVGGAAGANGDTAANGNGNGVNGDGVALATLKRKPSMLAESFQNALTSILFSAHNGDRPRMIAVTSAGPAEGKSTVVSNLAVALAEIHQRVLIIDGDMRRPRVHDIFGVSNEVGLSTLLNERVPLRVRPQSSYFTQTEVPGLMVLPSGPTAANASNLLYSPRLPELLGPLRGEFDAILIDTPPMLHLADARVLAQHCDSVILVVRAGRTTRDAALAALKKFELDGTPILGTILNDWNPAGGAPGYGGYYYRGYSRYYRSYK